MEEEQIHTKSAYETSPRRSKRKWAMENKQKQTKSGYQTPQRTTNDDHNISMVTQSTDAVLSSSMSSDKHEAQNNMFKVLRGSHSNISEKDPVDLLLSTKVNETGKRSPKLPSDMLNVDVDVDENVDEDEVEVEVEEDHIVDKAKKLLECDTHAIYFMIEPHFLSMAVGMTMDLPVDSLTVKEKEELIRIEAELDCRYEIDATFAKQLIDDSGFTEAIMHLRVFTPEQSKIEMSFLNSYVHCLNSMFENRYKYLYMLRSWITIRLNHLKMKQEKQGMIEFFKTEVERFRKSIPLIKEFKQWLGCIDDVYSKHEEDVKKANSPHKKDENKVDA